MGDQGKRRRVAAEMRAARNGPEDAVERAFDLWLERGLHQLYDQVAKEPVPDALLRLIEEDRAARETGKR